MSNDRQNAITKDFEAFMQQMQAAEPGLEPGIAKLLALSREVAFRAGWSSGQQWQEHRDAEAPTARVPALVRLGSLLHVGDRAWVRPLAIVEHIITGELFVDPRFTMTRQPSEHCCIEVVVAAEGLVAVGPTDQHRLTHEIDRERFRPLLRLEAAPAG